MGAKNASTGRLDLIEILEVAGEDTVFNSTKSVLKLGSAGLLSWSHEKPSPWVHEHDKAATGAVCTE